MSSADDDIDDSAAPLIEHLAELRTRLIWSVVALAVGVFLSFIPIGGKFIAEHILELLLRPIEATLRAMGDPSPTMQYTSPQEYLFTLFRISFVFGFGVAFPVISYQMWRFVAPGLYRSEKNAFLPFLIASPVMFLAGACFAQFVVTPLAMQFFLGFVDAPSLMSEMLGKLVGSTPVAEPAAAETGLKITFFGKVNESLDLTLKFIIAFGLCFQLPVLLTLMGKAGLASSRGLKSVRKYAIVGILLVAGLVTPPDVTSQLILFTVVYGLYEISIFLVAWVEKKKDEEARAEGILGEDESLFDEPADDDPLMKEFDEDPKT